MASQPWGIWRINLKFIFLQLITGTGLLREMRWNRVSIYESQTEYQISSQSTNPRRCGEFTFCIHGLRHKVIFAYRETIVNCRKNASICKKGWGGMTETEYLLCCKLQCWAVVYQDLLTAGRLIVSPWLKPQGLNASALLLFWLLVETICNFSLHLLL